MVDRTRRGGPPSGPRHLSSFLDLENAHLSNPDGHALFAPGITVDGGMSFRDGTTIEGQVSLENAKITGDLDFTGARMRSQENRCLALRSPDGRATGDAQLPVGGAVDLSHARLGVLTAHPDSTPAGIRVSELTYETLAPMLPASQRVRWITSAHRAYLPQPYEQLAASYRQLGHDGDTRTVLLGQRGHRHSSLALPAQLWELLQDITTGYGYRPAKQLYG